MDRIDSFNVMESLTQMYVFKIRYSRPRKGRYANTYRIESAPFNFKETCLGAMYHEIDVLKAKGMEIGSYYVEAVMASDTEKQF